MGHINSRVFEEAVNDANGFNILGNTTDTGQKRTHAANNQLHLDTGLASFIELERQLTIHQVVTFKE